MSLVMILVQWYLAVATVLWLTGVPAFLAEAWPLVLIGVFILAWFMLG